MSDKQQIVLTKEEQDQMENLIKQGQRVVFPERADQWETYVEDRFKDKYRGKDAIEALTIIEALNKGESLEDAKKILEGMEPNGDANGLVRRAVLLFADRGPEFWKDTSKGHISLRTRWLLFKISRENVRLKKIYQYALSAGNEPEKDVSTNDEKDSKQEPSKSWVLGEDEMQIVSEKQNEIAQKAKSSKQNIKSAEADKTDEYNKSAER